MQENVQGDVVDNVMNTTHAGNEGSHSHFFFRTRSRKEVHGDPLHPPSYPRIHPLIISIINGSNEVGESIKEIHITTCRYTSLGTIKTNSATKQPRKKWKVIS
jgi:hypothetical protein